MKDKIAAILLLIFLGFLGAHRMYMRRFKSGIIIFLLTATGIIMFATYPAIYPQAGPLYRGIAALSLVAASVWCLIDLFLILFGVIKRSNGKV